MILSLNGTLPQIWDLSGRHGWGGESGGGGWNRLSPGQSPLPLPATPGEATRSVRGEAGWKGARRRLGAGSRFADQHEVARVWLQRPPAAREAGRQLERAFQSSSSQETQARPLSSWGHRDYLVCTDQDPTDPLPLQTLQRWRQPPDRNPKGRGPLGTERADPGRIGRREGVLEAVSLDLRGTATGRPRGASPRGGWERVVGASRLLPSNSSSSSGPSRRQGRRRRRRTVRRYRLSVRRPRASRCPSRSSSRASEWPQRSASWRSRLSAARWLTSRSSASGCGGLRGHRRWGTTVRR